MTAEQRAQMLRELRARLLYRDAAVQDTMGLLAARYRGEQEARDRRRRAGEPVRRVLH